ncbi:RICIN domain-containing protein [Actinoplanes sp. CA-252034]|uniref:RICIN domain-containing protein n=1 Tax=Actinoplanes sp. CA-252034 TaxID=3239906 RepID=UPI003D953EEF
MRLRIGKALRVLVVALIAAASTTVVTATPASADTVQTFRNRATGLCLDDSIEFSLRQFTCNNSLYQRWNVHVFGDGTRQLRNEETRRCFGSRRNGSTVELIVGACTATPSKSWIVVRQPNGIQFYSEVTGNHCLSDAGGSYYGGKYVYAAPCIATVTYNTTVWY